MADPGWRHHLSDWSYAETVLTRLFDNVTAGPGDCWLWTRARTGDGYGQISVKRAMIRCHQVAYYLLVGDVPDGLQLDHLCRVRACCNPWHLDVVTPIENWRRGIAAARFAVAEYQRSKTHCRNGHPFNDTNTYVRWENGRASRTCRRCRTDRMIATYWARKERVT